MMVDFRRIVTTCMWVLVCYYIIDCCSDPPTLLYHAMLSENAVTTHFKHVKSKQVLSFGFAG